MAETPKVQADNIAQAILRGKDVKSIVDAQLEQQLRIAGKPISQLESELRVHIPRDNMTLQMCREIDLELMAKNQTTSFFCAAAGARLDMYDTGNESTFLTKFYKLIQEYKELGKRIPAAKTLETLAKIDQQDLEVARAQTEMEYKFWKRMLEKTERDRKYVENIQMGIQSEMKAEIRVERAQH